MKKQTRPMRTQKRKISVPQKKVKVANNEVSLLGKALRGLGALGGSALGGVVGMPAAGSAAGSSLGAAVSKWLGSGDYEVAKNTIVQRAASGIPMMHNTGQSITVRHREFIGPIAGSTAFTVQSALTINPGLGSTFPWLASIAARFQEYEFKGLVFHYVPTSGTFNGTSAALGAVMLQTTYRSTDSAPTNKAEMMNEYWATEVVPFDTVAHPIECDPKENPFAIHYVRTTAIQSGEPLMYDLARTFVATQGMVDAGIVGDLWVTYEVELKKPLISSPVAYLPQYLGTSFSGGSASNFFSGARATQGSLPLSFSTKTITIPAGTPGLIYIKVNLYCVGATGVATVAWDGAITSSNISTTSGSYDALLSKHTTTITGTNPLTDNLMYELAVSLIDNTLPATILYPSATITTGSIAQVSVVAFQISL